MAETAHPALAERFAYDFAGSRILPSTRLAMRLLAWFVLALPLAVIAIGAADTLDLPHSLQFLIVRLDVATYFHFGWGTAGPGAFVYRTFPINAVFYSGLLFALFSWRARRAQPDLLPARRPFEAESAVTSTITDPEISTLAAVFDSRQLAKQLQELSGCSWWGAPGNVRVKVLKWHRTKRCTFEITFQSGLVGKVYSMDRQDVYSYMKKLHEAGFGPGAELSIPQPIAYLSSLRLLLQESVEGPKAGEVFLYGDDREKFAAAESCARWLARFHALAPRSGQVTELRDELSRIRGWVDCLVRFMESLSVKFELLLNRLEAAAPTLGPIEFCAGHGSYSPDHVVLTRGRAVTLDWDGVDVGDPSRDVARFVVATQRLSIGRCRSLHALDGVAERFLKTYLELGWPEVEKRLRFYRAATCLRLAMYCAFHHRGARGEKKVIAMVEEGLRSFEQ